MITKQHTLASGKTVTLGMPDLFKLVATDAELPSQSLVDILDLVTYGAMDSGRGDDKKRLEGNRRFLMSQFQLAALCIQEPKLVLMGEVKEGDLTPSDLVPRDLREISDFFQTGGSRSVSTTADQESSTDTQADPPSPAMAQATE
jgi:hypothetical protein